MNNTAGKKIARLKELLFAMGYCLQTLLFLTYPLFTLFVAIHGLDKYPSPLLFVKFDGNARDQTRRNPDAILGSAVTFTTGPYDNDNGAMLLDGTRNSYAEWPNGVGGPLTVEQDMTFITW